MRLLAGLLLAGLASPLTTSADPHVADDVGVEDREFWNRFLRRDRYFGSLGDASMSLMIPTPQPIYRYHDHTKAPVPNPIHRPTITYHDQPQVTTQGPVTYHRTTKPTHRPTASYHDQPKAPTPPSSNHPTIGYLRPGKPTHLPPISYHDQSKAPIPTPAHRPTISHEHTNTARPDQTPYQQPTFDSMSCEIDVQLECRLYDRTSCRDVQPRHGNCSETLYYKIEISNIGSDEVEILKAAFMFAEVGSDGTNLVSPNPLAPGQTAILLPSVTVDLCQLPVTFMAVARIDAKPQYGQTNCAAQDDYVIVLNSAKTEVPTPHVPSSPSYYPHPTPQPSHVSTDYPPSFYPTPQQNYKVTPRPTRGPTILPKPYDQPTANPTYEQAMPVDCVVDVTLQCTTAYGLPCDQVTVPDEICSNGAPIERLSFQFERRLCSEAGTLCEDIGSIEREDIVLVTCQDFDAGGGVLVEPSMVMVGGTFAVGQGGGLALPKNIECTIRDTQGNAIQRNVINTSGDAPLRLQDRYGALRVTSCNHESCYEVS
jgi:hypothetical protein